MREIKFRAWDKLKKEFVEPYQYGLRFGSDGSFLLIDKEDIRWESDIISIMQFTGIKDKNGKEIYEGDIFDSPSKNKFYVKWWKDGWYYNNVKDEEEHVSGRLLEIAEDWEVIGNIYENLELLKKRTKK